MIFDVQMCKYADVQMGLTNSSIIRTFALILDQVVCGYKNPKS